MEQPYDFEEIRCFEDKDVAAVLPALIGEPHIDAFFKHIMPEVDSQQVAGLLRSLTTIADFQKQLVVPFVMRLAQKSCSSVELRNTEYIHTDRAAVYITNHRDIILDSAFLNSLLCSMGFNTAEIAIGDNLLIYPWIRDLVRLNKSFIVKRDVPIRQMLDISKRLSAYIHYTINEKKEGVWIAQREGRSKDSSDNTQASVIKMLALGGNSRSVLENIMHLNLQPVALSYEYDPCDYLKAQEYQLKRDNADYKKSKGDDLLNMSTGMTGYKGRVVFTISHELNPLFATFPPTLDKNAQVNAICEAVDDAIHRNMVLFPVNYVAYDLRFETDKYAHCYSVEEKNTVLTYLNGQMAKITLADKDEAFLWEKLLLMYSNPVVNFENLK